MLDAGQTLLIQVQLPFQHLLARLQASGRDGALARRKVNAHVCLPAVIVDQNRQVGLIQVKSGVRTGHPPGNRERKGHRKTGGTEYGAP